MANRVTRRIILLWSASVLAALVGSCAGGEVPVCLPPPCAGGFVAEGGYCVPADKVGTGWCSGEMAKSEAVTVDSGQDSGAEDGPDSGSGDKGRGLEGLPDTVPL